MPRFDAWSKQARDDQGAPLDPSVARSYYGWLEAVPVLGRMLALAGKLAKEQGAKDGFRTIINTGRVGRQEVQHVHIHVLGGPEPLGPMLPRKQ